jgi:hypothetical protein
MSEGCCPNHEMKQDHARRRCESAPAKPSAVTSVVVYQKKSRMVVCIRMPFKSKKRS